MEAAERKEPKRGDEPDREPEELAEEEVAPTDKLDEGDLSQSDAEGLGPVQEGQEFPPVKRAR